jgi:DNA ligase-1
MTTPDHKPFSPLLAVNVTQPEKLKFPMYASPKYDGIRCLMRPTADPKQAEAQSRKLKPIPNKFIRAELARIMSAQHRFDGELIVRNKPFHDCSSGIMSSDGQPDFEFHVFDILSVDAPFEERLVMMKQWVSQISRVVDHGQRVKLVEQKLVHSWKDVQVYETECLARGFEGVMLRSRYGPYKQGRSTEKEQTLLKLKRFEQDEAVVIGYEEEMHNANEATKDATGHTKRSSHKANKVGKGTLGALRCRRPDGTEFKVAGFTDQLANELWTKGDALIGQTVTYKHQPHGAKDAPRIPTFIGIRHSDDT